MNPHRLKAYFYLIIVTIIWGLAEPIIKFTLGGVPPLLFLSYRFGLSTVAAIITFMIFGVHFPKSWKLRFELCFYGFITSTVTLGLLFFGLNKTTVLDTTLITLMNPLLITFAGVEFLKEHITKREKIGMGVALLGTVITVLGPIVLNGQAGASFSGNILIFLYLIVTAWSYVLAKKLLRDDVHPLAMTNFSFIIGFVTLLPVLFYLNPLPDILHTVYSIPPIYHLAVAFMAIISGNFAYYLSNKAQKTIEISEASWFSYLYPVIAAPVAVIWLGEKITPLFVVGAVIITFGVILAEWKKRRYN